MRRLRYTYTNAGQLSMATSYDSSFDVLNQVQETYDDFGQLASDTQAHYGTVEDDSTAQTVGYSYDPTNGDRLNDIAYPDGTSVIYDYSSDLDNVLNRVTAVDNYGFVQTYSYLGLDTPVTFADNNYVTLSYKGTTGSTGGDAGDQYTGLDRLWPGDQPEVDLRHINGHRRPAVRVRRRQQRVVPQRGCVGNGG